MTVPSGGSSRLHLQAEPASDAGRMSPRDCADASVRAPLDVWRIAREFPDRWARFLHEAYRGDILSIQISFRVCERTARRWLAGEGGVRAPHHVVAQVEHLDDYRRFILEEAA